MPRSLSSRVIDPNRVSSATRLLWRACNEGDAEQVAQALADGACVCVRLETDFPPLLMAVRAGSAACVDLLARAGAPLNEVVIGRTALMYAIGERSGRSAVIDPVIDSLLRAGADPNVVAPDVRTALMSAVYLEDVMLTRRLLEAGADPNARDWDGDTALHWLGRLGPESDDQSLELARLLLDAGADATLVNFHGVTADDLLEERVDVTSTCLSFLRARRARTVLLEAAAPVGAPLAAAVGRRRAL